jgi:chemotaxis protein methyltransferase CheR
MTMDPACFEAFQRIAHERAGIFLRPGKAVLVRSRLARRLRELGLDSERAYLDRLLGPQGELELVRFLDAISTNFTHFFREPDHFESLREDAARSAAAGQRRFRFWSAGCSSGEEPYAAAMVLDGVLAGRDWRILATDLSTAALERARAGEYGAAEIEAIPAPLRERHLERAGAPGAAARWRVRAPLRRRVVFTRLNLAARPYPMRGPLDAAFCRNVMIYFDRPMRQGLVAEVERLLRPGGALFIGHSETLSAIATGLRAERPSVYRKPAEAPCP